MPDQTLPYCRREKSAWRRIAIGLCAVTVAMGAGACEWRENAPPANTQPASTPAPAPEAPAAPPAPAPSADAGEIADFPPYPGATRIEYSTGTSVLTSKRTTKAEWTTNDPFARVKPYYQELVASGGWTVTKFEEAGDEATWELQRGGSTAEIELDQDVGRPLKIEVERTDP